MEWLRDRGYRPIPVSQVLEPPSEGRPIAITFDDGYENFFLYALPVLVRLGFSATVFLVTNHLGGVNTWDIAHGDVSERLMTRSQACEAQEAGIELGSHTVDHVDLAAAAPTEAWRQITESRARLADLLGRAVTTFCYPYGRKTPEVRDMVERAGYRLACGTQKGPNTHDTDPFDLRRVNVRRDTAVPILSYKLRRDLGRRP
jgi:peptidoglycan/xylan/chitin deacetylase (PgdA/CDA1 family)